MADIFELLTFYGNIAFPLAPVFTPQKRRGHWTLKEFGATSLNQPACSCCAGTSVSKEFRLRGKIYARSPVPLEPARMVCGLLWTRVWCALRLIRKKHENAVRAFLPYEPQRPRIRICTRILVLVQSSCNSYKRNFKTHFSQLTFFNFL